MCKKIYLLINGERKEFGSESRAAMELGFMVLNRLQEMTSDMEVRRDPAYCCIQSLVFDDSANPRLLDLREINLKLDNNKLR